MLKASILTITMSFLLAMVNGQTNNFFAVQTKIKNGILEGDYDTKTGIQFYRGIPFAKPPVGDLRWKAPQPVDNWKGVRTAKKFGPRAVQGIVFGDMKSRSEGFGKEVQKRILLGTFVLSASYYDAYYTKAQKVRRIIRDKTKEILQQYDFIVMPITPTTAFKLGEHSDNPLEMYLADLFSVQANVAGVPAIALPLGLDNMGLPMGFQIIADDFEESKLLHFSNSLMKQPSHVM